MWSALFSSAIRPLLIGLFGVMVGSMTTYSAFVAPMASFAQPVYAEDNLGGGQSVVGPAPTPMTTPVPMVEPAQSSGGGSGEQNFGKPEMNNQGMNGNQNQNQNQMNDDRQQKNQEQQDKRDEEQQKRQDEQEKKMNEQRLKQMKQNVKQVSRMIAQFDKQLTRFRKKAGIEPPPETLETLKKLKDLVATITNAQSADEIEDVEMSDVGDLMQDLNDKMRDLEQLSQIPATFKKVDREISKLDKTFNQDVARLKRAGVEAGELTSKMSTTITAIKDGRNQADTSFNGGDAEEVMNILQTNVFEKMDDLRQLRGIVDAITGFTKYAKQIAAEIKKNASMIRQLKAKKLDVEQLQTLQDEIQSKFEELKVAIKNVTEPESLVASFEEFGQKMSEFRDSVDELTGQQHEQEGFISGPMPQQFSQMQVPQAFGGGQSGEMSGGMGKPMF